MDLLECPETPIPFAFPDSNDYIFDVDNYILDAYI